MRRLMETLSADNARPGRFRVVRILSTSGTTCTVELPSNSGTGGQLSNVRRLAAYTPVVGQDALMWSDGAFLILVGAIA
jgi:hypothetical protein